MSGIYEHNCHWHDRRRFLSMPIRGIRYTVTDQYISITEGYLRQNNYNIPLTRVCDVRCRCGLRQRLANQGSIIVSWYDGEVRTAVIENVRDPRLVTDLILTLSEEAKIRRRTRGRRWPALPAGYPSEDDFWDLP